MLTIHRQTVMMHPILDKYYERDPYHVRSSAFVQAKGLVSNEKAPASESTVNTPNMHGHPDRDSLRKMVGHAASARSVSPDLTRRPSVQSNPRDGRGATTGHQAINISAAKVQPLQGSVKGRRLSIQPKETSNSRSRQTANEGPDGTQSTSAEARQAQPLSRFFPELAVNTNSPA